MDDGVVGRALGSDRCGGMVLRQVVKDHSLSLACMGMGCVCFAGGVDFDEGQGWDMWLGLGHGFFTVGGFGLLSGPLRERNKPEK